MYRDTFIKVMSNLHAAFRSDSLQTTDEVRYRITHHSQTEQRVNWQEPKEEVMDSRSMEYTLWEEIDRWAADPERVQEPAWDSLQQCEEGYRRMESKRKARRLRAKTESNGGERREREWLSQESDLSLLSLLIVKSSCSGRGCTTWRFGHGRRN